jgi:hypothetical protein
MPESGLDNHELTSLFHCTGILLLEGVDIVCGDL